MPIYEHVNVREGVRSNRESYLKSCKPLNNKSGQLFYALRAYEHANNLDKFGKARIPIEEVQLSIKIPFVLSKLPTHSQRTISMSESNYVVAEENLLLPNDSSSGVSWSAIFVGAAAAAALSLALIILGFGLGMSKVSPWSNSGTSVTAIGISTIIWLAFTQITASAIGGYLAGRLRVKWVRLHSDEVYFRDTAHGFMAWAIASLVTVTLLSSTITSILSSGLHASATIASGLTPGVVANSDKTINESLDYYVDVLFRKEGTHSASASTSFSTRGEALKIFAKDVRLGTLPEEDEQYLSSLIAQEAAIPQSDAEKRVSNIFSQMQKAISDIENSVKQAADTALKVAVHSSLWMFVALALGAFFASLAGTFGGRQRDKHA